MKKQYVAPQLTVHGNVAEMTQVLGPSQKQDFVFLGGTVISGANVAGTAISNDIGSTDLTLPADFFVKFPQ